jgi:serine/threonine protein kinase
MKKEMKKNTIKNKNTKNNKTIKRKPIKGGKVLSSGGFGCIFQPALKCKSEKDRISNNVSKLMKKKYAIKEYEEITKYLPELKEIPNYKNYFLVDGFALCDPEVLDGEDLENFDKKCNALTKHGYNRENVNKNLRKLKILSMPYGGVDIEEYIEKTQLNYRKMRELNQSLQLLLRNGILPMNRKGIFHSDIKDSNVLIEDTPDALLARLIDWGLSTSFTTEKDIPAILSNRPFQFNVPFSNVLFNRLFTKMYEDFLKRNPNPDYISVRSFAINYTIAWIDERGPGHLRTLNGLFRDMFESTLKNIDQSYKDDIIEYNYTFYFIFEYLSQILFKFTRNSKFYIMEYFVEVFIKNIDIWGFVMIYLPILEYLYKNYTKLNKDEIDILNCIKSMILLVLQNGAEPINVGSINNTLNQLDGLFEKAANTSNPARFAKPSSSSSPSEKKYENDLVKGGTQKEHKNLIAHLYRKHKNKTKRSGIKSHSQSHADSSSYPFIEYFSD